MGSIIEEKSFAFAVKIANAVRELKKSTQEYELLSQLLRSGTSVGANVAEAKYGQSTRDYVSKFSIARKEANEAKYWLRLLNATGIMPEGTYRTLIADANELLRILVSIIKTTQERNNL